MVPVTDGQGPVQRVNTNAATQTLPSRSARWTGRPLRSTKAKSPTGPKSWSFVVGIPWEQPRTRRRANEVDCRRQRIGISVLEGEKKPGFLEKPGFWSRHEGEKKPGFLEKPGFWSRREGEKKPGFWRSRASGADSHSLRIITNRSSSPSTAGKYSSEARRTRRALGMDGLRTNARVEARKPRPSRTAPMT